MGRNGRHSPPRPRIQLREPTSASPEEAAAIAAAIEQFLRDTALAAASAADVSPWVRTALREGVGIDPLEPAPWEAG